MKIKTIQRLCEEEIDRTFAILNFFDEFQSNQKFVRMVKMLRSPADKVKAIRKFAEMIGIPESKLIAFLTNIK